MKTLTPEELWDKGSVLIRMVPDNNEMEVINKETFFSLLNQYSESFRPENEKLKRDLKASESVGDQLAEHINEKENQIEKLNKRILSLETLCKIAKVPTGVIECFSLGEINEDDIKWAQTKIAELK